MTSYIMEHHQKNASGNGLMIGQMTDTFRMPKDFPSLVYLSMVLQAEGIRYGVEHWRRHTDRVAARSTGSSTTAGRSLRGRASTTSAAGRRCTTPPGASTRRSCCRLRTRPRSNRSFSAATCARRGSGRVRWTLTTLDGKALDAGEQAASVEPQGVTEVARLDFSRFLDVDSRRELVFVAELWEGDRRLAVQTAFFVPTKHLSLVDPQIKCEVTLEDGQLVVEVAASSLARLVEISFAGADVVLSDNYFDLPAAMPRRVTAPLPDGWDLAEARAALRVHSVYETYTH